MSMQEAYSVFVLAEVKVIVRSQIGKRILNQCKGQSKVKRISRK